MHQGSSSALAPGAVEGGCRRGRRVIKIVQAESAQVAAE